MHVSGRLGNQLFEWSFAHELARSFQAEIHPVVDSRHFSLNQESIFTDDVLLCDSIRTQRKSEIAGLTFSILDKIATLESFKTKSAEEFFGISRQSDAYIVQEISKRPRLVSGFYINSSHVISNSSHLYQHLRSKFDSLELSEKIQRKFGAEPFQAIHIRRGDFIAMKETFGLLNLDWYEKNILRDLPLIVATDDIEGSREIIDALMPAYVLDPEAYSAWETLGILASAQRLVMANSTFSWWAGFCSVQTGNVAIFPKPFYRSEPWKNDLLLFPGFIESRSSFII